MASTPENAQPYPYEPIKGTIKVASDGRVHLSPTIVKKLQGNAGETLHYEIVDDEMIIRKAPL